MATAQDLIKKGKVAVRTSALLYPIYQKLFNEAFGYFPECPTCGSVLGHKHWDAFVAFGNGADPNTLLTQNNTTMSNTKKTFEVKNKIKLYAFNFYKKGQDRQFTSRTYGDVMTEEFAIAYLDNAANDPDLLDQRKAEFSILPSKYATKKETVNVTNDVNTDLSKLKLSQLQDIAKEKKYPIEEWEKFKSKADIAAYLEAKSIPDDTDTDPVVGADEDDLS